MNRHSLWLTNQIKEYYFHRHGSWLTNHIKNSIPQKISIMCNESGPGKRTIMDIYFDLLCLPLLYNKMIT